jgi:hypothetical protein
MRIATSTGLPAVTVPQKEVVQRSPPVRSAEEPQQPSSQGGAAATDSSQALELASLLRYFKSHLPSSGALDVQAAFENGARSPAAIQAAISGSLIAAPQASKEQPLEKPDLTAQTARYQQGQGPDAAAQHVDVVV